MEFFKHTQYDFIGKRTFAIRLSLALIAITILSIFLAQAISEPDA